MDLESTSLQSGENPLVDYYKRKTLVQMFLYIGFSTLFCMCHAVYFRQTILCSVA